ncbi:MAG: aminotransferase class V-fold PLP-dependent enzyme [Candidatus Omnitrophica bacterium]|nr:aminotransferase class V-fold PLP-dependent enzyme [Candidatus Omnitrophota bacterium]
MPNKSIYLDHNATTPLHPEVKKTIINSLDDFGNPSSLHQFGRHARHLVEQARAKVASFIGAEPDEVFFVGSGSEANNTVLSLIPCDQTNCSCMHGHRRQTVTTTIEHPCVLESSKCLGKRGGSVTFAKVDPTGKVDIEHYKSLLNENTGLASVMMANNEIGTIEDIKTLCSLAHEKGALFHTDAVQAVGKIPVNVKELDVDFLTLSGHKIYGPKGIGALYVRKGVPFCPLIHGGHQERGRRAGTENTLGIVGLGKAIDMRTVEMTTEENRLLKLKKILKDGIEKNIPDIRFNGHPTDCLPGTLNVSFRGAEGEALLLYLDLEGIAVSTGSACASGSLDPSHVLLATGIPVEEAHGAIRFSLGRDNTEEDIQYVITKMTEVAKRVRNMSTAYRGGKS